MPALVLETYTYEDYKNWEGDWELIYGHPYAMAPSPLGKHQFIMMKIGYLLNKKLDELDCNECFVLGETDYIISDDTVLKPDVALVCGKLPKFIRKPPIAIFEIISPSTKLRDEITKKEIYKQQKIPFYVMVYPDNKIIMLDLKNEKEIEKIKLNTPCGEIKIDKNEILEEITL